MAFVFGKSKKISSFSAVTEGPGPGEYIADRQPFEEQPAPFNSSTYKISSFDVDIIKPGPGSYDPTCPSSFQSDKKMRMTSSFISKVDRFKTEPEQEPHQTPKLLLANASRSNNIKRPQKTQDPKDSFKEMVKRAKQKMDTLQCANSQNKVTSIGGNRDFVRIILSNPKNTEVMQSVFVGSQFVQRQNGPGSYEVAKAEGLSQSKHVHAIDWSKNTNKRFKQQRDKNPGPGHYSVVEQRPIRSQSMSSAFAYGGLRSYMDEVIYKTKMPFKVKVIENKKLKDRYPGPGQYEPQLTASKSFHYGQDCFGSFVEEANKSFINQARVPGPGHYEVNIKRMDTKEELRKTRNQIFGKARPQVEHVETLEQNNKDEVRKQCIRQMERQNNKFYSLEERCTSKIGTISHAQRFRLNKESKNEQPGPGQYKSDVDNNQQVYERRRVQYGFNSTVSRCSNLNSSVNLPFYDIERHDLGKEALRIKRHLQNLKQIDIEKAPFNTREKRTVFEPNKSQAESNISNSNIGLSWNSATVKQRQSRKSNGDKKELVPNIESSIFKSKTKREGAIPSHFIGPGHYYNGQSMEKKSFNREYNYKVPALRRKDTLKEFKRQSFD